MGEEIYDAPSEVKANDGVVRIEGPDGVAVSITPDAAIETSDRLLQGGLEANGQRVAAEREAARRAELRAARPPEE